MKPTPTHWRSKARDATVLVTVRPPPTSNIYSSKIAGTLQTFGRLNYFKLNSAPHNPAKESTSVYRALFESPDGASKAVAASPLTVEAFHSLPTAKSLDPFNVFGLQQRKQPEAQTFQCEVRLAKPRPEERADMKAGDRRILITDERSGPLYRSLLEAEAPMNLLDGLSSTIEADEANATSASLKKRRQVLNLDELYRKGRSRDGKPEDMPPIRKHWTGGLLQRRWPLTRHSSNG